MCMSVCVCVTFYKIQHTQTHHHSFNEVTRCLFYRWFSAKFLIWFLNIYSLVHWLPALTRLVLRTEQERKEKTRWKWERKCLQNTLDLPILLNYAYVVFLDASWWGRNKKRKYFLRWFQWCMKRNKTDLYEILRTSEFRWTSIINYRFALICIDWSQYVFI